MLKANLKKYFYNEILHTQLETSNTYRSFSGNPNTAYLGGGDDTHVLHGVVPDRPCHRLREKRRGREEPLYNLSLSHVTDDNRKLEQTTPT